MEEINKVSGQMASGEHRAARGNTDYLYKNRHDIAVSAQPRFRS
jgi:hypothetical protein